MVIDAFCMVGLEVAPSSVLRAVCPGCGEKMKGVSAWFSPMDGALRASFACSCRPDVIWYPVDAVAEGRAVEMFTLCPLSDVWGEQ